MPKWGLTEPQRATRPWDLDPKFLRPAKVITDPIHGDIFLTEIERIFVDTEPVERLRRVKQLGNTHLVYPGATHSRFSHALGAVRVAQDLIDAVLDQRNNRRPKHDLFAEWERERDEIARDIYTRAGAQLEEPPDEGGEITVVVDAEDLRTLVSATQGVDRRIAEAIVAARLGALLHDLCHVPFGHSIEDELGILTAHDKNAPRFGRLWDRLRLPEELEEQVRLGGLYDELRRLILSGLNDPELRYPFVADIVGNTICADLLDYLERDHRFSGLPVGLGRRFLSAFYVMPPGDPHLGRHMVLNITRPDGRERVDVVTEVLKYLRYRYELSERALVHHAKLGADAMIGKALEMWHDVLWVEEAEHYLREESERARLKRFRPPKWLRGRDIGAVKDRVEATRGSSARTEISERARERLDDHLSRHGDDALLERLAQLSDSVGAPRRAAAVRQLARNLLDRRLFKPIATQADPPRSPSDMVRLYGTPDERRRIEEAAARWAGLDHRWQVLLWIPPATMRLKIADVVVDAGDRGILKFSEYERRGRGRGSDIYEAHQALWSIAVYLDPKYVDSSAESALFRQKVLASIARELNVTFPGYEQRLGKQAYLWPDRLAARETVARRLPDEDVDHHGTLVDELVGRVRSGQVQARGPSPEDSWEALLAHYEGAAESIDALALEED